MSTVTLGHPGNSQVPVCPAAGSHKAAVLEVLPVDSDVPMGNAGADLHTHLEAEPWNLYSEELRPTYKDNSATINQ